MNSYQDPRQAELDKATTIATDNTLNEAEKWAIATGKVSGNKPEDEVPIIRDYGLFAHAARALQYGPPGLDDFLDAVAPKSKRDKEYAVEARRLLTNIWNAYDALRAFSEPKPEVDPASDYSYWKEQTSQDAYTFWRGVLVNNSFKQDSEELAIRLLARLGAEFANQHKGAMTYRNDQDSADQALLFVDQFDLAEAHRDGKTMVGVEYWKSFYHGPDNLRRLGEFGLLYVCERIAYELNLPHYQVVAMARNIAAEHDRRAKESLADAQQHVEDRKHQ